MAQAVKIGQECWLWSRQHADYLRGKVIAVRAGVAVVGWQYGSQRVAVGSLVLSKPVNR